MVLFSVLNHFYWSFSKVEASGTTHANPLFLMHATFNLPTWVSAGVNDRLWNVTKRRILGTRTLFLSVTLSLNTHALSNTLIRCKKITIFLKTNLARKCIEIDNTVKHCSECQKHAWLGMDDEHSGDSVLIIGNQELELKLDFHDSFTDDDFKPTKGTSYILYFYLELLVILAHTCIILILIWSSDL